MQYLTRLLSAVVLILILGMGAAAEPSYSPPSSCHPTAIVTDYETGYTYIANGSGNRLLVIREADVVGTIPVGPNPQLIGFDQDRGDMSVVHRDYEVLYPDVPNYGLTVISGPWEGRYTDHLVRYPTAVAHWRDTIYVADAEAHQLKVMMLRWWETTWEDTGVHPIDIAVDPETTSVYVANRDSDTVTLIRDYFPVESIPVGQQPVDVEADPERGFAYVANASGNSVSIIHGGEVIGTAPAESPGAIAINPHTGYVYVVATDSPNRRVTILRAGGWPLGTTTLDFHPEAIKADPATGDIYVAGWETLSYEEQDAYVAVLRNMDVVITIPIRLQTRREYAPALNISIDPTSGYAYVSEYNSGTVTVLHNAELVDTVSACLTTAYLPLVVRD